MLILALDTTSEKGGVGIFQNTQCLGSVANDGPANLYSVTLFQMVQGALAQSRLEQRQIDLYAVANGPGSFTGIRVGLAAARAWGKAFGKPVRGVSVLEALVNKASPATDWAFPILDARRGEFYLGWFRTALSASPSASGPEHSGKHMEAVDTGWVLKPEPLQSFLAEKLQGSAPATCVVRAHDPAAYSLRESLPASLAWQRVDGTLMDSIAALAWREQQTSHPCPESDLDAYYIRRPDAEINWKD